MTECRRCGLRIRFERRGEKWWPVNLDGSSHWDLCKQERRRIAPPSQKPGRVGYTQNTHFWIGAEPPWDELLGEYRDFTDAEKTTREVCAP